MPSFSVYCASKWAVEGFTEAVQNEIDPAFNIKFTCIEPGPFRSRFLAYLYWPMTDEI